MKLSNFKHSKYRESRHCLLLGHPVDHSLSPLMHNAAIRQYGLSLYYLAVDVPPAELSTVPSLLVHESFVGANVTIPYKQQVHSFVDRLDESAEAIGAVNTLYLDNGRLAGANTDAYGFAVPLKPYEDQITGGRAVVFGTGGASRAVVYALGQMGVDERILVSRTPQRRKNERWPYEVELTDYQGWGAYGREASLIVNTTPLGLYPEVDQSPVRDGEKEILADTICYDLVYRPRTTRFLEQAKEVGAQLIGGLPMLIHQGSRSFEYWTGRSFPIDKVEKEIENAL